MDIKFKTGDEVYEKIRPAQKLIVTRYMKGIYYCKIDERRTTNDLIYFERDLMHWKSA